MQFRFYFDVLSVDFECGAGFWRECDFGAIVVVVEQSVARLHAQSVERDLGRRLRARVTDARLTRLGEVEHHA